MKQYRSKIRSSALKQGSLERQILLWMVVVSMVPLIIMAYQGYHCARQAIVESTEDYLLTVSKSRGDRLESWIAERYLHLAFFAMSHLSVSSEYPELKSVQIWQLDSLYNSSPQFKTITIYDLNWKTVKNIPEINGSNDVWLPEHIKSKLKQSKEVTGELVFHHKDQILLSYMGRPIYNGTGRKTGYIVATLDLSNVAKNIFHKDKGSERKLRSYLISKDGFVLTSPSIGKDEMIGKKNKLPSLLSFGNGSKVFSYIDYRNRYVLAASQYLPNLKCTFITEVDWDETMEWITILKHRAFGTGLVTLLVIIFLSIKRAKQLAMPLKLLAQTASMIVWGHHDKRVGYMDTIEAQEVADTFNNMLDELDLSRKRLVMSASLAAIGELSSSVVHEIRNPLSSIKINLQALEQKVKTDKVYSELARLASDQVLRIERMLNGLLNFGKPLHLTYSTLSFTELWKDVTYLVAEMVQDKHVKLELIEQDHMILQVDRDLMVGVFTNLIKNAVEAVDKEGQIRVSIQKNQQYPSRCIIKVADNGSGLKAGDLKEIFTPFFTTREDGTGLGLANVKKIVEYHGGTITADNSEEGGAIFTIDLPIERFPR